MLNINISRGSGSAVYRPVLLDGATWATELDGAPGRFSFRIGDDPELNIAEGDRVEIREREQEIFQGNIFTRRRNHHGVVSVVAYDQTRYLKNKDTACYSNITASTLLREIAAEYRLKLGRVEDTKLILGDCAEDNKSLAQILHNALRETEERGGGQFSLFDDFGELTLIPSSEVRLNILLNEGGAQEFSRSISIDKDTYNQIKLVCDGKAGRQFVTASDKANMNRWGHLQYLGKISDDENAGAKANSLLKLYNRERRELSIDGIHGDLRVRAGCSLWVGKGLSGGDEDVRFVIKKATHHWKGGRHSMDLEFMYT